MGLKSIQIKAIWSNSNGTLGFLITGGKLLYPAENLLAWCREATNASCIIITTGLEINEKIQSQFCDKRQKFSHNFTKFSCKIVTLNCVVSGVAK